MKSEGNLFALRFTAFVQILACYAVELGEIHVEHDSGLTNEITFLRDERGKDCFLGGYRHRDQDLEDPGWNRKRTLVSYAWIVYSAAVNYSIG
jgi:hypothetical protein